MKTRRRRVPPSMAEHAAWQRDREVLIDREQRTGLGLRPREWWRLESGRPDLAADPADDVYAHLRSSEAVEAAAERLTFLAESGQLTPAEVAAIHRGAATEREPAAFAWRSRLLRNLAR